MLANETASGFLPFQNWDEGRDGADEDDDDDGKVALQLARRAAATRKVQTNAIEPLAAGGAARGNWAGFTYTVSMAYAWGREQQQASGKAGGKETTDRGRDSSNKVEDMHVGYLDDEVVLGIGVDDVGQGFARVRMGELVGCMRACPGIGGGAMEHGEGGS